MTHIKINKGHNIRIAGVPEKEVVYSLRPDSVAVIPIEFPYVKPKLLVNEEDTVKIGSPLFFDKRNPDVKWGSLGGGVVKKIQYGERRVIERIIIELDDEEESISLPTFLTGDVKSLGRDKVLEVISGVNLLPLIRQRPFNKVINPQDKPKAIFISGVNTAPLTVDLELALEGLDDYFQAGLDVLTQLTEGQVHLTIHENTTQSALINAKRVTLHRISGSHPSGNVGIQIHHIDPINPGEIAWTISAQNVVVIGKLFLSGKIDPSIIVTVGGPSIENPLHIKTRLGAPMGDLLAGRIKKGKHRIITGDVLTGKTAGLNYYLGFYDTTISVIPKGENREFLGMIAPGSSETRYSLSNAFFGFRKVLFPFTTLANGSERALVPIGAWESVLPMDILPNPLYRSILARDIEEMEKLGILECDEEDFALCSFACPSKIDVGAVIRQGLDLMEKEV